MWTLTEPWYELIIRALVVYSFLFLSFRLWGKKHFGQLAPFDFLLLLIMSEAVQNALVGDEKSLTGGLVSVATMLLLTIILSKLAFRSKRTEKLLQGTPKVLIRHGEVFRQVMEEEQITEQELHEALRQQGAAQIQDVGLAMIETNGEISVVRKEDFHPSP